jgi:hypothetical protein
MQSMNKLNKLVNQTFINKELNIDEIQNFINQKTTNWNRKILASIENSNLYLIDNQNKYLCIETKSQQDSESLLQKQLEIYKQSVGEEHFNNFILSFITFNTNENLSFDIILNQNQYAKIAIKANQNSKEYKHKTIRLSSNVNLQNNKDHQQ